MNIEKKVHWYHRFSFTIYYILIFNLIVVLSDEVFYKEFWVPIQFVILILVFLLLLLKQNRIVYKLNFDDINQRLYIYYYQFVIFGYSTSIPYSQLNFKYHKKNYGIVNRMYTLFFLISKRNVAEIPKRNDAGWTKQEIQGIIEKLNSIIGERNLKSKR